MSIDPTALRNEILNDPVAIGLKALVSVAEGGTGTTTKDATIAAVLNFIRDGVTADPDNGVVGTAITVFRNDITPKEIVQCIAAADFTAATQLNISKLQLLFQSAPIDATLANVRANFQNLFSGASAATQNALSAVAQRKGSRAEQLWGTGTTVQSSDVSFALRGK